MACSSVVILALFIRLCNGFGNASPSKVIVTGAAGRTGRLVFSKINKHHRTEVVGLVRTENSAKKLMKDVKCGLDQLVVCDVTEISDNNIPTGLEGADAMVICTSAVPVVSKYSMVKAMLKIPLNLLLGKKAMDFRSLRFKYRPGQYPEMVDYEGQIKQIDLAKKLGITQVVIVSSMGGTDPSNFLNTIGKKEDGTGNGDILLWKRKAEQYLVNSGLHYTIIHPGGLRDTPGCVEQLILDVDDKLLANEKKSISRSDVANLCVAALNVGRKQYVSFDAIGVPVEEGKELIPADVVLKQFLETGRTTYYSE